MGLNLQEISTALDVGKPVGEGGDDIPCVYLPQAQVSGRSAHLSSAALLCRVCRASSGSFWRLWDNLISGGRGTEQSRWVTMGRGRRVH